MSGSRLIAVLEGRGDIACGVTWLGEGVAATAPSGIDVTPAGAARIVGADFAFVDADGSEPEADLEALVRVGVEPVWAADGPLARVAAVRGWECVMRDSARDPAALIDRIEGAMKAVDRVVEGGSVAGARVFLLADEIASSAGWLLPPSFVTTYLMPLYESFAAAVRGAKGIALFHSDGDLGQLAPMLASAGFRGVHGATTPELSTYRRVIESAGLAFVGGIPVATTIGGGGEAVRDVIALAMKGPLALCDDGAITSFADLLAVERVFRELREQRADLSDR